MKCQGPRPRGGRPDVQGPRAPGAPPPAPAPAPAGSRYLSCAAAHVAKAARPASPRRPDPCSPLSPAAKSESAGHCVTAVSLCPRCEVFASTPSCKVQSESGLSTSESPRKVDPRASLPARRATSAEGSVGDWGLPRGDSQRTPMSEKRSPHRGGGRGRCAWPVLALSDQGMRAPPRDPQLRALVPGAQRGHLACSAAGREPGAPGCGASVSGAEAHFCAESGTAWTLPDDGVTGPWSEAPTLGPGVALRSALPRGGSPRTWLGEAGAAAAAGHLRGQMGRRWCPPSGRSGRRPGRLPFALCFSLVPSSPPACI